MPNIPSLSSAYNEAISSTRVHKGLGDLTQLSSRGWHILNEELSLPAVTLSHNALQKNLQWMQSFSSKAGVKLAPHGKTSMAPALFKAQIDSGAWGISLANATQAYSAYQAGVSNIIVANQLVGKQQFATAAKILKSGQCKLYCFVDSLDNLKQLNDYFDQQQITLSVLIELGVEQGRCGVRNAKQARQLASFIANAPALELAGIGFYEGVIHGANAQADIESFIDEIKSLAFDMCEAYSYKRPFIITGAGSAWYDVVAKQLGGQQLPGNMLPIIRPGCYAIHDTGIYQDAQQAVKARSQLACDINGDLTSSLNLWAYVQSVPEAGMAVINFGKRDAAFDAGLPTPQLHYRPGSESPTKIRDGWSLERIMDQHAMLSLPVHADIAVGDIMCFSTSHPCLTLDKWRFIGIEDEHFRVTDIIETHF